MARRNPEVARPHGYPDTILVGPTGRQRTYYGTYLDKGITTRAYMAVPTDEEVNEPVVFQFTRHGDVDAGKALLMAVSEQWPDNPHLPELAEAGWGNVKNKGGFQVSEGDALVSPLYVSWGSSFAGPGVKAQAMLIAKIFKASKTEFMLRGTGGDFEHDLGPWLEDDYIPASRMRDVVRVGEAYWRASCRTAAMAA